MTINLTEVNGIKVNPKHKATCHCGSVEIELDLPDGLIDIRRCDCSLCRRRGAIAASVPLSGINVIKGSDALKSQIQMLHVRSWSGQSPHATVVRRGA